VKPKPARATTNAAGSRLFVAIALPADVRRGVEEATTEARRLDGLRWSSTDQLHITLRFIGNTAPECVLAIEATLAARVAGAPIFELDLRGAGAFPSVQRPRVVWIGARRTREFDQLYEAVEAALVDEGVRPDDKTFRPHVTVARVRSGPSPAGSSPGDLSRVIDAIDFTASFEVGAVSLIRSELTPSGARHVLLRSCPLAAETDES